MTIKQDGGIIGYSAKEAFEWCNQPVPNIRRDLKRMGVDKGYIFSASQLIESDQEKFANKQTIIISREAALIVLNTV